MLMPPQVIPFLQHADPDVRDLAGQYLARGSDRSTATADDFWKAFDQYGLKQSKLLGWLAHMPQTDSSLTRLLEALRAGSDEESEDLLLQALEDVAYDLLAGRREEILSCPQVPADSRQHLEARLALAKQQLSLDALWDQLQRHAQVVEDQYAEELDWRVSRRLVEALARHGEPAGARATEVLRREDCDESWLGVFAAELVGQVRYRPAADALIQWLGSDADALVEEAANALVRIADEQVVRDLEQRFAGEEWEFRLTTADLLGRVKLPAAEQAILRLLPGEEDYSVRAALGVALCELCTTEGPEQVRQLIIQETYGLDYAQLDEQLLALGKMVGYEPPEAPQWAKEVAKRQQRRARRLADLESRGDQIAELKQQIEENEQKIEQTQREIAAIRAAQQIAPVSEPEPEDVEVTLPIRRQFDKVGRNDPCPCGSGKKYKKCCMGGKA